MAKPNWLTTTPASGSGNGTISNSGTAHTGRVARTGTVTVTGVGVATPATYKVTQEAKAEYVSFDNGAEMAASKEGGALTITGKSNSSKLTFSFVGDAAGVEVPATYIANGSSTANGTAIAGDPGAVSEFIWSVSINLPENATVDTLERVLKVTANGGQSQQITIKQAAGDAYISVDPTEIIIPQDGSSVSVNVTSNTSWTVS